MVEYSDRLNHALRENGVTARQLAAHLGVTYQAVKKVIDGKSAALNAPNHVLTATFLGISSEWLALGKGLMRSANSAEPESVKIEKWPFGDFSQYESLSPAKKEQLAQIVEAFIAGAQENKSGTKKTA